MNFASLSICLLGLGTCLLIHQYLIKFIMEPQYPIYLSVTSVYVIAHARARGLGIARVGTPPGV